jgi:hypothetical protein
MITLAKTTHNHPIEEFGHIGGWNLYMLKHHANMPTAKVEPFQKIM